MKKTVEKYVLANIVQHRGKASSKAVMNKVIGELGKKNIKFQELSKMIDSTIKELSEMSMADNIKRLKKIWPDFFEEKEVKEKQLPELADAIPGKVVVRFAPSPSGPLHIGHAYGLLLNKLYKDKYEGKFILRLEDTNPANILNSAYKQIEQNAKWATRDGIDEIHVQSDRMKIYYGHAKELIGSGFAYVCTCLPDKFKEYSLKMTACPCRQMRPKEHLERWTDMFLRYLPGEAALRIKTELEHKNPAIREWVAFRIIGQKHPRQGDKYRVWPTMNFCVAIDDHLMKLTHVIRGKDHEANTEKQEYIFRYFRWIKPQYIHIGRINFKGLKLSSTEFKQQINSKVYSGWDDVRLPTLFALERRGIQPEALERMVKEIGPTKSDKTVEYDDFMKTIYKFNKDIIDPISNRFYFVADPVKLKIAGMPSTRSVEIRLHPEKDVTRLVTLTKTIRIPKKDFNENKGEEIRLKGLYNIRLGRQSILGTVSSKFTGGKLKPTPKVQWVTSPGVKTEIIMPDGSKVNGISEKAISTLEIGTIIQFERFGFVKLDKIDGTKSIFVFLHE